MAVTKLKAYHGDAATENTIDYSTDLKKTIMENLGRFEDAKKADILENVMGYAENEIKTSLIADDGHTEVLVSGHHCKVDLAVETFKRTADTYHRNGHNENAGRHYKVKVLLRAKLDKNGNPILDSNGTMIHDKKFPVYHDVNGDTVEIIEDRVNRARTCYMWVMSFPPASVCGYEIDPRLVHQIGLEFMDELEKECGLEFPAVISSHMDKKHLHNHINMGAYSLDGHHKYLDTMETLNKAREISDRLSMKYDLPVILEPENGHSLSHDEWKLIQEGKSWKDTIRKEIVYNLDRSSSYTDFLTRMYRSGYTLRETDKHITYYTPNKDHRCRDINLGIEFSKDAILKQFEEQDLSKKVQQEHEDIIDPTLNADKAKPLRVYVSRYTQTGRRRGELEMLLLKAIKIMRLLGDKFSDKDDASDNPIRKNANWKISRLVEAINILGTYGINTKKELDEKLLQVGAEYSHTKKDFTDLSQGKKSLEQIKDWLENARELQIIATSLGITDTYLTAPTQKEINENRAKLFPMTSTQRRDLFLALQDHPLYKISVKYDTLTYEDAKKCISFLQGKTDKKPVQLTTLIEGEENLENIYSSIAGKTLQGLKERLKGKPIPVNLKTLIDSFNLPIDTKEISFAEGVHLTAYYKPWEPNFISCKASDLLVSEAKVMQLKELLDFTGKKINIPVEQLSKKDADTIFRNLVLSRLTPETLVKVQEKAWIDNLKSLTYEERGYVEEYREMTKTIAGLGYDINDIDNVLLTVTAQLNDVYIEETKLQELAKEYSTFKQLKMYTDLSKTNQFTHGPKWQEKLNESVVSEEVEKAPEKEPEEQVVNEERNKERKTFNQETDIDF